MKESLRDIILFIQYNGIGFSGFELQPGQRTIRGELEKALAKVYKHKISIVSAARTDAGVHSLENVISFQAKNTIPLDKLPSAINSVLPSTIRIVKAEKNHGHVRYDAKSKLYEYLIFNGDFLPPQLNHLVWQVKPKLNLLAMKKAAKYLVGRHDFSSFCAAHSDDKYFVRNLSKLDIGNWTLEISTEHPLQMIRILVEGNGFLYRMVRNIVGTLVDVGLGKIKASDVKAILEARDRKKAGKTAPPQGLSLVRVAY